jgi:hypothetical protein
MKSSMVNTRQPKVPIPTLWHNRDYMILWSGQAISLVGTGITQTAFPLLVWDRTHSALQVGLVGAMDLLPYVFLSLLAGALVDRWNRKWVMILCDSGRALNLASLLVALLLGHLVVVQLYLNALIEGLLFVFFNLAEVASLPQVVAKDQLPAATSQNEATQGTTWLVAPLLGGALYSLRPLLPFLADAISYVVSVCSLLLIRTQFQQARLPVRSTILTDIHEGLAWLWHQPLIRYMAFLTGGWNFASGGFIPILVVLVKLHQGSSLLYGTILTIGGMGGILGALLASPIQKHFRFGWVIISSIWIQALLWPLYAFVPNLILIGVIFALGFVTGPIYNVVLMSYRLALIPDALQGRVNSVFRLIAFGFQPLGWALTGLLIQTIQVIPTILVISVGLLALAILTTCNPHVRHAQQPVTAS